MLLPGQSGCPSAPWQALQGDHHPSKTDIIWLCLVQTEDVPVDIGSSVCQLWNYQSKSLGLRSNETSPGRFSHESTPKCSPIKTVSLPGDWDIQGLSHPRTTISQVVKHTRQRTGVLDMRVLDTGHKKTKDRAPDPSCLWEQLLRVCLPLSVPC